MSIDEEEFTLDRLARATKTSKERNVESIIGHIFYHCAGDAGVSGLNHDAPGSIAKLYGLLRKDEEFAKACELIAGRILTLFPHQEMKKQESGSGHPLIEILKMASKAGAKIGVMPDHGPDCDCDDETKH